MTESYVGSVKKKWKIAAILLVTTAILVALAALADPTIRYRYIGVNLSRDLPALDGTDPLTVMLSVETGTELIPEDQLAEEPAVQDEFSLFLILREEFKNQEESASVHYSVEKMESEQWAWQEAQLDKLEARTQVFPQAIAQAPTLTVPKESVMASAEIWTPLISSFWPKLPPELKKARSASWQEQVSLKTKNPMTAENVKVNYNLVYTLENFVNTERGLLANIRLLGSIRESGDVDQSIEVRGTIKGVILVEPDSGRTYGGEYRIEERFLIRQPNLPVFRKVTYQGARFWRPMYFKMSAAKPGTEIDDPLNQPAPEATASPAATPAQPAE